MENSFFTFLTANENAIKILSSIITMIIAVSGALWVAAKTYSEIRKFTLDRRDQSYSDAIKQFSRINEDMQNSNAANPKFKKSIIPKLSALQTVTKNCPESYEQIFYLCALEADVVVKNRLRQALREHSRKAYKFLTMINRLMEKIYFGMPAASRGSKDIFNLDKKEENRLQDQLAETKLDATLLEVFGDDLVSYDSRNISQLLILSSSMFGEAMLAKHFGPFVGYTSQLLFHADFYHRALRLTTFDKCVLNKCISNQFKATLMTYQNCYIIDDNFSDARFNGCRLSYVRIFNSKLNRTKFRHCNFERITFRDCLIKDTTFSWHRFTGKCSIVGSTLRDSTFYHKHIDNLILYDDKLDHVKFVSCVINRMRIIQCFVPDESKPDKNSTLKAPNKEWKGATFRKCHFKETSSIVCTDMQDMQFIDCIFDKPIELHKNKNLDLAFEINDRKRDSLANHPDETHFKFKR